MFKDILLWMAPITRTALILKRSQKTKSMAKNTRLRIEALKAWLKEKNLPKPKKEITHNDYEKPKR
jgi:hypothetical protein